ncbi:MAG: cupin domain-containing protein [Vulcanisaeta sp. AZ3]|jgi:quercetin dioxygenase-like cupin family protein|nr:MAG: cupin [Vulcanisaeta sp. AZ3]
MNLLRGGEESWERLNDLAFRKYAHGSRVTIAQFKLLRGSYVKPHSHPHEQVSIVIQGRVRFTVGNEEIELRPGDAVLIPPNVMHDAEALEDSLVVDVYSPIRDDWIRGEDNYLRS